MKNVLGIIGSTRKMGNSELAVKLISRHLPAPHSLNLIRLSDLNIKPCLGCYQCMMKEGRCVQKDDMEIFLDALAKADGVILSVPVYFFGPNGAMKMIIDRAAMMYPRFETFFGKPCLIAILLGVKGMDGYTSAALGSAVMTMGLDIMGEAQFLAAGLGDLLGNEKNHKLAEELAGRLFSPRGEIVSDGKRCQVCGSRSFKFLEDGVECLVCQNRGALVSENGRIGIRIRITSTSELNALEDRRHHWEWVKGSMDEYKRKRRKDTRRLGHEFAEQGLWIKGAREVKAEKGSQTSER